MRRGPDGSRAEVEDRRITRWFPVIRGTTDTSLPILELLARRDLFAGHSAVPIGSVTRSPKGGVSLGSPSSRLVASVATGMWWQQADQDR
jgi:hypothetical protein